MNTVKLQVRSTLVSDSTYITLLGSPTASPYKTYYIYPPTTPNFPFVVFSLRPGSVNKEIGKQLIEKRIELVFNVWAQNDDYEDIAARIIFLLHQVGNSNGFRTIYDRDQSELYDKELNAYGVSIAFDLHYRKGII